MIDQNRIMEKVLETADTWEKWNLVQGVAPRAMYPEHVTELVSNAIRALHPDAKLSEIQPELDAIREKVHQAWNVPRAGRIASRQSQVEREEWLVNPTPGSLSDNVNVPKRKATPLDSPRKNSF